MDRTGRTVFVVALLVASLSFAGGVGAVEEGPYIEVGVNGQTVLDGERVVVPDAELTVRVSDDVGINTVAVRVNGVTVTQFSPNETEVARTIDAEFSSRDNTVQVIATNSNDVTSSQEFTVYRDTVPPEIGLSSPFSVEPGYVFPANVTDTDANVTLEGTVRDAAEVTEFEARIVGDGSVKTTDLDTDSGFSLQTTLGVGNATLRITATDEFGNERRVRTRLTVVDEAEPAIEVQGWPENATTSDTVTARIRATDDVGIETLTVRPDGQIEQVLAERPDTLFDAGRDIVVRDVTIELPHEGVHNVTINATDTANHSTEIEKSIEYDPVTEEEAAVPDFVVNNDSSGFIDDSTYHLNATVTNGSVTTVVVESSVRYSGRPKSYLLVYNGTPQETVRIDRNLSVGPREHVIRINATDTFGVEHGHEFIVDPRDVTEQPTTQRSATATTQPSIPTTDPTPTPEPQPTSIANVEAVTEAPLDPATETTLPLSPATGVVAIVTVSVLLWRRSKPR